MPFLDDTVGDQHRKRQQTVGKKRDEGHVRAGLRDQADQDGDDDTEGRMGLDPGAEVYLFLKETDQQQDAESPQEDP